MVSRRQRRVAELIHEEISNILQFETHDPRIGFVTVTGVEVSPDLRRATIFISHLTESDADVLAGLRSATPFFRRVLGQHVHLRYTPELRFELDHSILYGQRIDALLSKIDIPPAEDNEPEGDEA